MMAQAKTSKFSEFLLLLGDGADPEVFAAPCGLTSRGISFSADTDSTDVPDCSDESLPSWKERDVTSKSASISGSGVMDKTSRALYWAWYDSGDSKNIQIKDPASAADKGGYWSGKAVITSLDFKVDKGQRVSCDISLESDGAWTWTDAS